jgi:hypothetical protein
MGFLWFEIGFLVVETMLMHLYMICTFMQRVYRTYKTCHLYLAYIYTEQYKYLFSNSQVTLDLTNNLRPLRSGVGKSHMH